MLLRFPGMWTPALMAHLRRRLTPGIFSLLVMIASVTSAVVPSRAVSAQGTIPSLPPAPEWLEPRGLSIVDMVGFVPEEQLRDAILVYETGTGLVQYVSGSRSGNTVTINVRITPRYGPGFTVVGCLAQPAAYDQWPTVVPSSTMQVFASEQDVTSRILLFKYTPAGQLLPEADASGYLRYERTASLQTWGASPVNVPANGSCQILIDGRHENLTARFTLNVPPRVSVTPMGDQTFYAHSYIGDGGAGELGSLVDQMTHQFGTRHDSFSLTIPAGADYMFVKYGSTAFDPYAASSQYNFDLAGSGTLRLELSVGRLAVDIVNSMGLPTTGNWRDADLSDGSYLPYSALNGRIKTPEYFLPPGIPFEDCMKSGGCPRDVLDQIYNQTFPVQVYYFKVERLAGSALTRVPLKMVGKGWAAAAVSEAELAAAPFRYEGSSLAAGAPLLEPAQTGLPTFLPLVWKSNPPAPPETLLPGDPTGCPCGWFDAQGAMLDFIPPQ